jgi:7-cyano-7-deazaguanine reductase
MAAAYTDRHARAGIDAKHPPIEVFANHFSGTRIRIKAMEYTSVCPKTGLPDHGTITIDYVPDGRCLELKSLKFYLLSYRNLGIFYENAVNCILRDVVKATKPVKAKVIGKMGTRGGLKTTVIVKYRKAQQ